MVPKPGENDATLSFFRNLRLVIVSCVINDEQKLSALLPHLQKAQWLAIDTEADSLHAYPEKLCLLQISFPGGDELIDPLAGLDLSPVWSLFKQHQLIMHGADYDLRLLRRAFNFVPEKIFDTMI